MKRKAIGMIGLCILLLAGCGKTQDTAQDGTQNGEVTAENVKADESAVVAEFGKLCITLPGGFQESTTAGLYLNPDYPSDPSNVYLYATEKSTDFAQTMQGGQQEFVDGLVQNYQEQYGEAPEVTVFCYRPAVVGLYNAYEIEVGYTLQGITYHQLEYIIDAEQTYYVAYTQAGTGEWMNDYYTAASGMYFME